MKNLILGLFSALFCLMTVSSATAQYAEPAVTGANFVPNEGELGAMSVLTISFANTGSSAIPAASIEMTISSAMSYYSTDGVTVPTGPGADLFSWVYLGADIWRGTNISDIPAFTGGAVNMIATGYTVSPSFETTNINVQPVSSFNQFSNNPNNDNLQVGLKVNQATSGTLALDNIPALAGQWDEDSSSNLLAWNRTARTDIKTIELQRSIGNTESFETIATFSGKNNTRDYSDKVAEESDYYYRLKFNLYTKSILYANVIVVSSVPPLDISIYPNPATNYINIDGTSGPSFVDVFSVDGSRIMERHIDNSAKDPNIDVSNLAGGIYFVKVYANDRESKMEKIVILR